MPLSSADVRNVAFSKSPIGKRGYHEDEVDAFLDLVGAELARLLEENTDLHYRVKQLDQRLRTAAVDAGRNRGPLEPPRPVLAAIQPPVREQASPGADHSAQAAKVLGMAQQIADRLTGEARAEADATLSKARTKSAQLLSEARTKADSMVTEARNRAETVLNDAQARVETLDRQSRDKAASLEREAVRKHSEIIGSISQEKGILEKKIEELRAFEREYRTHLKTYLEWQLRELDGRRSAPPEGAPQAFVVAERGAHAESGNHRCDPTIGSAGAARSSARNGPPDRGVSGKPPGRWKPAVGLDGVEAQEAIEPWAPAQRSVS